MCPPTNNPTMNVPKLGKIILDDNTLVSYKYLLTCFSLEAEWAALRSSVPHKWVGMWARPGTLRVLYRNNSVGDFELSMRCSKFMFVTVAKMHQNEKSPI